MTLETAPRRMRGRIAADSAHAWARNLRLHNSHAKSVLCFSTMYVNDQGAAWPSLQTLADDTELSVDTVRRRLEWLESIGAVARLPRWIDDRGVVNYEKRGRQTSDEIRFQFDADPDLIEARALGRVLVGPLSPPPIDPSPQPPSDPSRQLGSNSAGDSLGTRLGVAWGSHGSHPLNTEGKDEEENPQPPKGALRASGGAAPSDPSSEPEGFAKWFENYPGWQLMDRQRAADVWRVLSDAERTEAGDAMPAFKAELEKQKRKPKDAHRFLRERLFKPFVGAKPQQRLDAVVSVREGSEQWHAWDLFYRIIRRSWRVGSGIPEFKIRGPEGARVFYAPCEWPSVGRDLEPDFNKWQTFNEGSGQFAAWRDRLTEIKFSGLSITLGRDNDRDCRTITVPQEWPPAKHPKPEQQQPQETAQHAD